MNDKPISEYKQLRQQMKETRINHRWVKKMRKFGSSDREIAKALGIPEDSPVIQCKSV
jgi:DNA-binding GntR family transcriptional regulator